jgi:hypothetical protein
MHTRDMHARVDRVRRRLAEVHLRHSWVTVGLPGEPLHLQCKECFKLRVLRDPERFEQQVRAAEDRYATYF